MDPILIIEDQTQINNLIADMLEKAGYCCVQAYSGTEGFLNIKSRPFSLVHLDLMLPGMSGEALLPQIRRSRTFLSSSSRQRMHWRIR